MANLKTYHAKKEDAVPRWVIVDVKNQVLGRVATQIARTLIGKDNPMYTPGVDLAPHIIVINAKDLVCTSKNKKFYWHTGYPGGIKEESIEFRLENKPEQVMMKAVQRMLPKNKLGAKLLKKLRVFSSAEHDHIAQNPEVMVLEDSERA
ncbi:50S ribosomal protein L13 [Gammaproteobacteria bacterium]|nr:50S ribosomal protein L13 [Gammaproteobacteria bacterium]